MTLTSKTGVVTLRRILWFCFLFYSQRLKVTSQWSEMLLSRTLFQDSSGSFSMGMIISISIAILINSIITNIYFVRYFDFKFFYFFKRTFLRPLLITLVLLPLGLFMNDLYSIYSWGGLLVKISIFSIVYFTIIFFLVLNVDEKKLLTQFLNKVKK